MCQVCILFQKVSTQWHHVTSTTSPTKRNQILFQTKRTSRSVSHILWTPTCISGRHQADGSSATLIFCSKKQRQAAKVLLHSMALLSTCFWTCWKNMERLKDMQNTWRYDDICDCEWTNGRRIYHFLVDVVESHHQRHLMAWSGSRDLYPSKWDLEEGLPLRANIGRRSTSTSLTKTINMSNSECESVSRAPLISPKKLTCVCCVCMYVHACHLFNMYSNI